MRLAYLYLPRLPLQRRVLEVPDWASRPCVLWEEWKGARRVAFASRAALAAGIRRGQPLAAASALVAGLPQAPFLAEEGVQALSALGESLMELTPSFQVDPPEGLWLEASAAHLHGGEEAFGECVLEVLEAQGLRGQLAFSSHAFTARALAQVSGPPVRVIAEGHEARALAPLPLTALGNGGDGLIAALMGLGLTTVGEVAALPAGAVVARGGAPALELHRRARGEGGAPFVPTSLPEAFEERLSLDWAAHALEPILFGLKTLVDRLCARLQGRRRAAVRLGLWLGLESGGETCVSLSLARPTSAARMLLDLLRHRMEGVTLTAAVTSLRLLVEEDCRDPGRQLSLGEGPEGDAALEVVLSRLASTLGEEALCAVEPAAEHRPEAATRRRPFRPPARPEGLGLMPSPARKAVVPKVEAVAPSCAERPTRLLTPPVRLEVSLRGSLLQGAQLSGKWRRVEGLSGPERLVGGWWQPGAHARDYYRAHLEGVGWIWLFRDGADGGFYLHGLFD